MSKLVNILLSRQLTVNLGKDAHGQPKTVKLEPGLQQVEREVAENWFVKAHCQEITAADQQNGELQAALDNANKDLQALQAQHDEATSKIAKLEDDLKIRDKKIMDLDVQLAKALQAQPAAPKPAPEPAAEAKADEAKSKAK